MPLQRNGRRAVCETYRRIYDVIERIPAGRVATYGQIARVAGLPGRARQVGYALSALPESERVAWHRVINSQGEISPRSEANGGDRLQRALLEREGIVFEGKKVSLGRFLWQPKLSAGPGRKRIKPAVRK